MKDVLRFWTAARMIEGDWHIEGEVNFGLPPDSTGKVDLTDAKMLDWQFSGIVKDYILMVRSKRVLEKLQKLLAGCKGNAGCKANESWLPTFLCTYVLLNTYTLLIRQQQSFAKEMGARVSSNSLYYTRSALTLPETLYFRDYDRTHQPGAEGLTRVLAQKSKGPAGNRSVDFVRQR